MRGATGEEKRIAAVLLARHGRTYCGELHIPIEKNTPSALFRWLCAAVLFSHRISAELARRAAAALAAAGWTSPRRLAQASWEERVRVLNRAGYARYDESAARMLGEDALLLLQRYRGDLRNLRERALRDPAAERRLLKEFKGIGEVGADIFCREVQGVWDELYPFADKRALAAARRLGLAADARALVALVDRHDFPRLVAALIRTSLAGDYEEILAGPS
ncbi:MAG TPA: hypothetical protein VE993_18980 [Stellaceae bacterium]|nr:hypothetical protein [Stellaceae bacterium]